MKRVFYVIVCLLLMCVVKFFVSSYKINYEVGKFNVQETALKKHMYFEIDYKGVKYNFMFYEGRKLFKKMVRDVKVTKSDGVVCLNPDIKGYESYTICSKDGELLTLPLANNTVYEDINDDFLYNNNLSNNEFILIWKYDGFYYLNGDDYKSINIFNKDRYSNDLMFKLDKYLIFPEYSSDYQFNNFIVLDMESGKYEYIDMKDDIHYDSYIVGNRKNNFYIFDNKSEKLYEVNYKRKTSKVIGNEIDGYIKYVNNKKEEAKLQDYKQYKITYFESESSMLNVRDNYFTYSINNKIKTKYFNDTIKYIDKHKDNIYFINKDNIFRYNNQSTEVIAHYFEFNFNNNNIVYIYNK